MLPFAKVGQYNVAGQNLHPVYTQLRGSAAARLRGQCWARPRIFVRLHMRTRPRPSPAISCNAIHFAVRGALYVSIHR